MADVGARFDELVDMEETNELPKVRDPKVIKVPGAKVGKPREFYGEVNNFGLVELKCREGKPLPKALIGAFTNMTDAENAVKSWLSSQPEREVKVEKKEVRKETSQEKTFTELTEDK